MVSVARPRYRAIPCSSWLKLSSVLVACILSGCVQNPYSLGSDREHTVANGGASGGMSGAGGASASGGVGGAAGAGVGTTCDDTRCVISCGAGECAEPVICPDGVACHVICGDDACAGGVTCAPDAPCQIDCLGERACGALDCNSASTCAVNCAGTSSCPAAIDGDSAST